MVATENRVKLFEVVFSLLRKICGYLYQLSENFSQLDSVCIFSDHVHYFIHNILCAPSRGCFPKSFFQFYKRRTDLQGARKV